MEGRQKEWSGKALMLMGLLLVSFVGKIASLSVTVNDIECIYEYVLYEDDTVSGNFVVVDHDIFWGSDHPGLDLIVSSSFPKTQLHREHLDPINVKIAELREALESVTLEQKYLKARDVRHRHTNESTRRRVVMYTVGEYIALAAASALQVVYIRKLFSKSVGYNRV
ncbi:unnamed protein product [Prunus armeniaca]|uniref:GOLD domain-containing protein n=1 Tax=Prunus armeniaca TaxID=36596 RepID=A0A6J5TFX4_PRUAR|nr:unnamed protein product [Prunus armeniaca]